MTSDQKPKKPFVDLPLTAKVLVTSAVAMILSLGLCKLGFWQDRNVHDGGPNTLDALGGLGFVLGLLLFLVTLLVVAIAVLSRAVKKGT